MNRKKKLMLNSSMGILKQIIALGCGFVLPRYLLIYFGSSANGLVSSISHFLGFISLLEMGIGPVIQSNLYKPLAEKNQEEISKIIKSSTKFFRTIALIFIGYIAVLCYLFPNYISSEHECWFTVSLLIIISISTFAQYFFGATYQLLLNADQKSYIQLILQSSTILLNTVAAIILMKKGCTIQVVYLSTAIIYLLRPVGQAIYVRKHYNIDKKVKYTEEPIKQKWNGFSQHLALVVSGNIDVVLLTFFSTLENVSVYSVYYNVVSGITNLIMSAATGLESLFGNMIAKEERSLLLKTFSVVEFVTHNIVSVVFAITMVTIVPFVSVYTKGINDANYIVPVFGILIVTSYASHCLRVPYFRMIKAAGHFKETQNGAFIATGINVIVSTIVVFKYGLIGVAAGTLAAMLFHTCYFVWYLQGHIIYRKSIYFLRYVVSDIIIFCFALFLSKLFEMKEVSYLSWVVFAIKNSLIIISTSVIVNLIFHSKMTISVFNAAFQRVSKQK